MYIYMYVCVCVCMYICLCVYIRIYTYICAHICILQIYEKEANCKADFPLHIANLNNEHFKYSVYIWYVAD